MAAISKRTKKNGEISYRATIRIKGFPETSATFSTEQECIEWAQQTEKTFKTAKVDFSPLLSQAIDRYQSEILIKKSKSQQEDEKPHLKFWQERLGTKFLRDITPSEIEDIANEIYKIISKRSGMPLTYESRRKYLTTLSFLYNTCIKEWRWLHSNPVTYVNKHVPSKKKLKISITDRHSVQFYNKVHEMMEKNGISINALARKVGCALSTMQHCLDRNSNITFQMMIKTCKALDLEFEIIYKD